MRGAAYNRAMGSAVLVKVSDLYRYYGETAAVSGIDFEVRRGEILGFLGPNGAGKTTTMQMVCGALAPSAGQVEIGGVDLLAAARQAKRRLGYLPERAPLYRDLTVDEYLDYCMQLRRVPRARRREARNATKLRCGLAEVGKRLIGNLSKGYQQRLGIAQAIVHEPEVLVLDEPTVGLDPVQIREIRKLIRELGRDRAVILSTHLLPEVQSVCDRVQIMHRGRLVLSEHLNALPGAGAGAGTLIVAFARGPPPARLAELPGVAEVQTLPDGRFRLHHADDALAERLVSEATQRGWGLRELIPERNTLEELFVAVTCAEEGEDGVSPPAPGADSGPRR